MKKILYILILLFMFIPRVSAKENIVNIYLFHSNSCPHCKNEIKLLNELEKEYDNIRIYKYEVSNKENGILLGEVSNLLDAKVMGVPFTIIGEKYFSGYSEENSKKTFIATIEYYSENDYEDIVGNYINNIEIPDKEQKENNDNENNNTSVDEFIDNYGNYELNLPIIGKINTKDLTLPVLAIVIGLIDGFNPCAMWVLLFLISMLIGMKDRKKMFVIGFTFLFTSAFIYFLFMILWLNIASLLTGIFWLRTLIGIFAIIFGTYNFITTLRKKEDGCTVVDDKKRNKIFDKIKKFTTEKNLLLALIGVITLAVSVNLIELTCSAGLPLVFTEILSLSNISKSFEIIYILIYVLFFLLDDLIIFIIAMFTLKLTGVSTKYGKVSKIIGGLILIVMGILLIFFPEIIMLNF